MRMVTKFCEEWFLQDNASDYDNDDEEEEEEEEE